MNKHYWHAIGKRDKLFSNYTCYLCAPTVNRIENMKYYHVFLVYCYRV